MRMDYEKLAHTHNLSCILKINVMGKFFLKTCSHFPPSFLLKIDSQNMNE